MYVQDMGYPWEEETGCDLMDGLDGLKILYGGKDVEGEVLPKYTPPKDPVFKEIIFSLDGKKYKLLVEEVQE